MCKLNVYKNGQKCKKWRKIEIDNIKNTVRLDQHKNELIIKTEGVMNTEKVENRWEKPEVLIKATALEYLGIKVKTKRRKT